MMEATSPIGGTWKEVRLEKLKFTVLTYLSGELSDYFAIPPKVDIFELEHFAYDQLAIRIIQEIYGEKLDTWEVRYPADWRQAFKARFFPRWALKRWPVKETVKRFDVQAVYPKISLPGKDHRILVIPRYESDADATT